jgi:hypothetical protein
MLVKRLAEHLGLPEKESQLLAYVMKAPREILMYPEFVAFRDLIAASCRLSLTTLERTDENRSASPCTAPESNADVASGPGKDSKPEAASGPLDV